jgi:tetratricopeptide (TPR) repeat protein
MVRTALATGHPELAERLIGGVEPTTPYHDHALVTAKAALAEGHGDHEFAVHGYADAAERWQTFGVVPEQAFALLGQGRCLIALGYHNQAAQPLQQARAILATLQAAPALAETDNLLQQTGALSA